MVKKYFLYFAWFQAIIATLGSLYLSEVLNLTPCILCWYQRIFMYPLVFIIGIGILKKDAQLPAYVLPFSMSGVLIAFYHNLLQFGLISETNAVCTIGVSCTQRYSGFLGFITIPLLSLIAFSMISFFMLVLIKPSKKT